MKRTYLIILLTAIVLSGMAQTIGEAFYIYRNDGQFNAFFRDEVQSIEYSYYDADSVKYEEIVTQVVITADSMYKIPLAAIDSVGFVQPETIYKPGVIDMQDGLRDYIILVNENIITLDISTPRSLIPHVGDKMVTTEMSELFPIGYAGLVNAINTTSDGIVLSCESVSLEDVFEFFVGYTQASIPSASNARRALWDNWTLPTITIPDFVFSGSVTYQPEPIHHAFTQGLPNGFEVSLGDWAGKYQSRFEMTYAPRLWVNGFIKIAHDERFFRVTVTGDYFIHDSFSGTGKLSWNRDAGLNIPIAALPVCQFLQVFVEPGLFVKAELSTSTDMTVTQHYGSVFHYEWSSNETIAMEPVFRIVQKEFTISGQSLIKGELAFGGYLKLGVQAFNNDKDIASIYGRAELGLSVEGNVNFDVSNDISNSLLYDNLRNSYCQGSWYTGSSFEAQLTPFLKYHHDLPLGKKHPIWTSDIVPTFSNVSLDMISSSSLYAETEVSGDLMIPVNVGFALFNENGDIIGTFYAENQYQNQPSILKYTFTDIAPDHTYTVYPVVSLNGIEMLASPSGKLYMHFPVSLSDFKVTDSQYVESGFLYQGVNYDYRFDVSVTATLDDDATGIADWGYVYLDPNGKEAYISLKEFGYSYTDKRWAYFRNEAQSTCTLYGYVKYVGSDTFVYGEPNDFPLEYVNIDYDNTSCPDENHPHWIDLGLPSGTLWQCCNEGASKPEEYGGYYDLGSVASAPTLNQIRELLGSATSEWIIRNGVYGRKFKGSNGSSIFLPAAGCHSKLNYDYINVGIEGYYYSSTLNDYNGNGFSFNSKRTEWGLFGRNFRRSVRPVKLIYY